MWSLPVKSRLKIHSSKCALSKRNSCCSIKLLETFFHLQQLHEYSAMRRVGLFGPEYSAHTRLQKHTFTTTYLRPDRNLRRRTRSPHQTMKQSRCSRNRTCANEDVRAWSHHQAATSKQNARHPQNNTVLTVSEHRSHLTLLCSALSLALIARANSCSLDNTFKEMWLWRSRVLKWK